MLVLIHSHFLNVSILFIPTKTAEDTVEKPNGNINIFNYTLTSGRLRGTFAYHTVILSELIYKL